MRQPVSVEEMGTNCHTRRNKKKKTEKKNVKHQLNNKKKKFEKKYKIKNHHIKKE